MQNMRLKNSRSGDTSKIDPSAAFKKCAESLILSQKVMTLATPWKNGAWSAPVYYLYRNKGFYFFSARDSRHIKGVEGSGDRVGASVFADGESFHDIRGIQMHGRIDKVKNHNEALSSALQYMKRFGIGFDGTEPLQFIKDRFRASFFRFSPERMRYMDNGVNIGFKTEINMRAVKDVQ